jgi:hypothetical protein
MKHEIIFTEHYALIVSDEEMKKGDFNVPSDFDRTSDISITSEEDLEVVNDRFNGYKKVIAHLPLTDAPILEGVPLLPEFSEEDDVEKKSRDFVKYVGGSQEQRLAFIDGYLEAKETYRFSEDDLRKALLIKHDGLSVDYVIQSLQTKRPKYFECEMEQLSSNESFGLDYGSSSLKPKTIANSQNQTELIGTYYYG